MQFQQMQIQYEIFKENGHFVAYSKPLDLVTQGKTYKEAVKRFAQLVPIFINDLRKRGTLDEVLIELGWTKMAKAWSAPIKVGEAVSEVKVPCPA